MEKIARVPPWDNGAGPLWGRASGIIARVGGDVVVSLPVLNPGVTNLSRVSPALYVKRGDAPFERMYHDRTRFTREPMPLMVTPGGNLVMTANPMTGQPRYDGPRRGDVSRPEILIFCPETGYRSPARDIPRWSEDFAFTEHSYRSSAIDRDTGEMILVNQFVENGQGAFAWTYRDTGGNYRSGGRLTFPVRTCYAPVSLRNRQVHIAGVSDIQEPNTEWADYKLRHTRRQWDYDFRMLLYKSCDDITRGRFTDSVCIASRDETCGHVFPQDIHADADGVCHVLYTTRRIWHPFMRDRFFPGVGFDSALEYASVKDGSVIRRALLDRDAEGADGAFISTEYCASFQERTDGSMAVLYSKRNSPAHARRPDGYYRAGPDNPGDAVPVELPLPPSAFCLAGPRAGNRPRDTADLFILAGEDAYYAPVPMT
ncbi:MAG: hypothetical protein PHZ09_14185 [Eubacteriales bacterium]|nr:hypothetical protein [Eubacteriales bacterium]